MLFIEYPKCSTCKKAKAYLDNLGLKYIDRDIKLNNPTKEELETWINSFKLDINKLFNTSGIKYRELNLKDRIKYISDEEKLEVLSSDGMLVKRPIVVLNDCILIGFKMDKWDEIFLKKGNK